MAALSGEIYGTTRGLEFQQAGVTDQALAARRCTSRWRPTPRASGAGILTRLG